MMGYGGKMKSSMITMWQEMKMFISMFLGWLLQRIDCNATGRRQEPPIMNNVNTYSKW